MTKVPSIREELRNNRENACNLRFGGSVNILAKENGGFLEIRNLTRKLLRIDGRQLQ
jgi:hypothetical protein